VAFAVELAEERKLALERGGLEPAVVHGDARALAVAHAVQVVDVVLALEALEGRLAHAARVELHEGDRLRPGRVSGTVRLHVLHSRASARRPRVLVRVIGAQRLTHRDLLPLDGGLDGEAGHALLLRLHAGVLLLRLHLLHHAVDGAADRARRRRSGALTWARTCARTRGRTGAGRRRIGWERRHRERGPCHHGRARPAEQRDRPPVGAAARAAAKRSPAVPL